MGSICSIYYDNDNTNKLNKINMKYKLTQQGDEIINPNFATISDLEQLREEVRNALDKVVQQLHDKKKKR